MDSNTMVIGVIIVLFGITLYILNSRSKKKKEAQFLQPLSRLAEKDNCKISQYDIWNDSVIGIDETQNTVFAIRKKKEKENSIVVNLAEIFRCRVIEVSRTSGPKEGNAIAFDRIDLAFINKDKSKADVVVEFFDANTDRLTLTGELQLAEKWCVLVNNKLASLGK
ncbi:MAG: hypothetical protein PHP53_11720 [Prolixibacteraceae bacterium]|nr:hypothetical protein [Prolixibacteraceae bacterium]